MKEILAEHYADLVKIGEGAMGEVWRGTDTMLERDVAIKVMKSEIASQPDFVERFRIEAVALAKINHPNIVGVYAFRQQQSISWMALEFVSGTPLDKLIATQGAMTWRAASNLIIQALQGLERAHAANIIHRDIKPSNAILTQDGVLKLMDFGIARVKRATKLTRTGYTMGTVYYMAPEQILTPDKIDQRTDLYSIGVMFYEMLTGVVPFQGDTEYEILDKHVKVKPPDVRSLVASLPPALDRIIQKALEKDPEKRFANATEFRLALEDCLFSAPADGADAPKPTTGRSKGMLAALGVAAAAVVGLAAAGYMFGSSDAPKAVVQPPEPTATKTPVARSTTPQQTVQAARAAPPASTATAKPSCQTIEGRINTLVSQGDLKAAIKETGNALDANCGDKFREIRISLVNQVRSK
jgi:serine/threonine-protein kinase